MSNDNANGTVHRLSISSKKGDKKDNVENVVVGDGGIVGDVHANTGRQISLLPFESFKKLDHPDLKIHPGDFAENITTIALDFKKVNHGIFAPVSYKIAL